MAQQPIIKIERIRQGLGRPPKILQELEIGLKPILDNLKPDDLSVSDKEEILEELDKLEALALQIRKELINEVEKS